jgi:hypothetical protein
MESLTLIQKLNVIQTKLKAPKNQWNEFGKYSYRNCEDILESVKPLLNETRTSLTLSDEMISVGNRNYVKATATLYDNESDTVIEVTANAREAETVKGQQDAQITGATSSYARKYALNGLFAIDDTKDADSQNNEQGAQEPPKKPAQKAKQNVPFPEVPQETKSDKLLKALNGDKDRYMNAQQWIDEQFGEHVNIDDISDDDFAYLLSKVKK